MSPSALACMDEFSVVLGPSDPSNWESKGFSIAASEPQEILIWMFLDVKENLRRQKVKFPMLKNMEMELDTFHRLIISPMKSPLSLSVIVQEYQGI